MWDYARVRSEKSRAVPVRAGRPGLYGAFGMHVFAGLE